MHFHRFCTAIMLGACVFLAHSMVFFISAYAQQTSTQKSKTSFQKRNTPVKEVNMDAMKEFSSSNEDTQSWGSNTDNKVGSAIEETDADEECTDEETSPMSVDKNPWEQGSFQKIKNPSYLPMTSYKSGVESSFALKPKKLNAEQAINLPPKKKSSLKNSFTKDSENSKESEGGDEDFFLRIHLVIPSSNAPEVLAIGKSIIASSQIKGDLVALGEEVDISSTAKGAFIVAKKFTLDGIIQQDLQVMASRVYIDPDAYIEGDAKFEAHRVFIKGEISKDLYVKASSVIINGTINGDAYVDADKITVGRNGQVLGSLYYPKGATLKINDKASIFSKEIFTKSEKEDLMEALRTHPERVQSYYKNVFNGTQGVSFMYEHKKTFSALHMGIWALVLFGVGYLILRHSPKFMKKTTELAERAPEAQEGFKHPLMSILGNGVLGLVLIPISIVFLMVTIIGIPLAILLTLVYILYLFLSKVLGIWVISQEIWYRFKGSQTREKGQLSILAFLIGVVLFMMLKGIPVVGAILVFFTLLLGSGVLWLRLFRRGSFGE